MKAENIVISVFAAVFKVVFAVVLAMLTYRGALKAYEYGQRVFNEPAITSGSGRSVSVTIPEGSGAAEIGELLEKKGLIRESRLFVIQEMFSKYRDELQAGSYELNTSMTMEEMMGVMAAGESVALEEGVLGEE